MSDLSEHTPAQPEWLEIVREKVAAMRFGSVQIYVHEGRVTQIEANERTRIAHDASGAGGAASSAAAKFGKKKA